MTTRRVLHIIDHLELGGAQQGIRELIAQQEGAFEHHAFVLRSSRAQSENPILPRCTFGRSSARFPTTNVLELVATYRQLQPDIVHAHLFGAQIITGILAQMRIIRTPLVFHERGILLLPSHTPARCLRPFVKKVRHFFCVSNAAKAAVLEKLHLPDRNDLVSVLHSGLEFEAIRERAKAPIDDGFSDDSSSFKMCFCGRLSEEKGCSILLQAIESLTMPFELKILGDGPERSSLEKQLSPSTQQRVTFLGARDNSAPYLRDADLLIVPSLSEAFPRAVLEAYALGTAVVASAVGGIPELLKHEESGLLVPPGDPTALSDAIVRMQNSLSFRQACISEAYAQLPAYSFEHFLHTLESRYLNILST